MKHFSTYDMDGHGFPMEDHGLLTNDGGWVYVYVCNTCRALTFDPKGHEKWHEDQA